MPFTVQPHPLADAAPRSAPLAAPAAPLAAAVRHPGDVAAPREPNLSEAPEAPSGPRWVFIAAAFLLAVAAVIIALARR